MDILKSLISDKPKSIEVPVPVQEVDISNVKATVDPLHYMQWNRAVKKPLASAGRTALSRRDYNRRVEAMNRKNAVVGKSEKLYTTQSIKDWVNARLVIH